MTRYPLRTAAPRCCGRCYLHSLIHFNRWKLEQPPPPNIPFRLGDLGLHLYIYVVSSLGPLESTTQTTSRSVQPFLYRAHCCDLHTDRSRYTVVERGRIFALCACDAANNQDDGAVIVARATVRVHPVRLISVYYVYTVDAQTGTRHLTPPRRRTRQLLSGRVGCARGQTSCGLDAKRQTAVSRVSEPAVSR